MENNTVFPAFVQFPMLPHHPGSLLWFCIANYLYFTGKNTHTHTYTHSHRFKQHLPLYPVRVVKSCSSYGCTSKRSPVNETQPAQSAGPVQFCQHWTNRETIPLNGCVTHMYIYTFSPVLKKKIAKRHFQGRKRKPRSRMQQVCKVWLVLFIALSHHSMSLWKKNMF